MKKLLPDNLEKHLASLFLAAIVPLMLLEAAARHLMPQYQLLPLKAAGGCLAWMASLGMARAAATGVHVKVGFVADMLAAPGRRRLSRFADAAFLLFAGASFGIGCFVLARSLTQQLAAGHPLIYAAIPVGSLLAAVRLRQRLRAGGSKGNGP